MGTDVDTGTSAEVDAVTGKGTDRHRHTEIQTHGHSLETQGQRSLEAQTQTCTYGDVPLMRVSIFIWQFDARWASHPAHHGLIIFQGPTEAHRSLTQTYMLHSFKGACACAQTRADMQTRTSRHRYRIGTQAPMRIEAYCYTLQHTDA